MWQRLIFTAVFFHYSFDIFFCLFAILKQPVTSNCNWIWGGNIKGMLNIFLFCFAVCHYFYITFAFQKPLDLILPEGGGLTLATAAFLKDMHSVGKNGVLNPGHLFGQVDNGYIIFFSMQVNGPVYM